MIDFETELASITVARDDHTWTIEEQGETITFVIYIKFITYKNSDSFMIWASRLLKLIAMFLKTCRKDNAK